MEVSVESGDRILAVVSVKFILSSYRKNAINTLEQQIGETANLRRQNIVYGNLFFLTNPIPSGSKEERITPKDIRRYRRLRQDHEHLHSPDEMAIGIVEADPVERAVLGRTGPRDLPLDDDAWRALDEEFSVERFFPRMALRIRLKELSP